MGAAEGAGRALMRVLVTGAGGQLGPTWWSRAAGDEVVGRRPTRELDVGDRDAVLAVGGRVRAGRRSCTPRRGPPSTRARATLTGRSGSTRSARATSPRLRGGSARTSCTCRPTTCSTAPSGAVRRVGRASPAVGLRAVEAGGRARGGLGRVRHHRAHLVGVRRHGANMVKTVAAAGAAPGELRFVDDQRGYPTFTADLAPLIRRLVAERRPGPVPRHQPGRGDLVRVRARRAGRRGRRPGAGASRSRPPTSTRPGPRRGRRTRCSTTPRCGCRASPCCRTTASRWSGW